MKTKSCIVLMTIFSLTIGNTKNSSNISVKFNSPEKFTDFKSDVSSSKSNRSKLMKELENLIIKSSGSYVNSSEKMEIIITNVDMKGSYFFGSSNLFRVVKDTDRSSLEFSYKVTDMNGFISKQGEINLTNRNLQSKSRSRIKNRHSHFTYEMTMYDTWLKKNF